MSDARTQSKAWMFTINNPTSNDIPKAWPGVEYCAWQLEKAPSTGTPHLQGYAVFIVRKDRTWLLKNCLRACTWAPRKGTHDEAKAYVQKKDTRAESPWTIGSEAAVPRKRGERTDFEAIRDAFKAGSSLTKVAEAYPSQYIRCSGGVEKMRRLMGPQERTWQTFVQVFCGPGGTGKSTRARWEAEQFAPGDVFTLMRPNNNGTVWWDGYDGQAAVIIEEFDGSWMRRVDWRLLCDRGACPVQTKGGSTQFLAKRIYITTNVLPHKWWRNLEFDESDARRLINDQGRVIMMRGPGVWQQPGAEQYIPQEPAAIMRDYWAMMDGQDPTLMSQADLIQPRLSSRFTAPLSDDNDLISARFGDPNPTFRFPDTATNYHECNVENCSKQVGTAGDECRFHAQLTLRGGQPLWRDT